MQGKLVAIIKKKKTDNLTTQPRAGKREWIGLAVIALPCLLYSMDLTVLNLAVPTLSADLKPSSSELLWIIDIYGFMVAGFLITMGNLGDRIGRRRLLLIGAAAFGAASIMAAFSRSAGMLIATRALLGIAGATLAPSTLSLIRNMFHDHNQRTFAIGVWITSYSVGGAVGPLIGGLLLENFWWGSVFLISLPVMILLLVLGPILLPEFRDPKAQRIDFLSVLLSLTAVLGMIYGLKRIAENGPGWIPLLSIIAGLFTGIAFVARQKKLKDPLIDLDLFKVGTFSASLLTYLLGCFVLFGIFIFIAQYLQSVLMLSPLQAGLWTMPLSIAFIFGSMLTPLIVRRRRPGYVVTGGLIIAAIGFGILAQVTANTGFTTFVTSTILISLGLAPVFTLATDLIVGTAPPERAGSASAISETCAEFGGALGIAILGSIGTAVYRSVVVDSIPSGVPPDISEAAMSTLGAAVSLSQQLPGELGGVLLETSRYAFIDVLQLISIIAAIIMISAAILAIIMLRGVGQNVKNK